jgi:transposase InsO family protein
MSRQASPISGKPYGLSTVCRVWRLARSGVYRQRALAPPAPPQRRGPVGPMPDTALLEAIRTVLASSPFHGEGHRKVWARLRLAGTRTSLRRVLRLMRENGPLAPSRVGAPRGPRNHDGTIIPETVDTMWGTDLTSTIIGEGQVAVFVAVGHCSAECVGIHAACRATRFEALEPIRQAVRRHFGAFGQDIARGLAVRHDHGSQDMSEAFQKELAFLGIESSPPPASPTGSACRSLKPAPPAFVRAPEGNGCAERFIRTLKENLLWVRTFETVEQLRLALLDFRKTYNTTWLIERHGFRPPTAIRQDQLSPAAIAA